MGVLQPLSSSATTSGSSGNVTFRAGQRSNTVTAGTITCTKPTGTASGDVLYALFLQDTGSLPTLAGWTQLATADTPGGRHATLLRKVAGGAEGSSYVFVITSATACDVVICSYVGVNATPEDATTTSGTGTASQITYPTITSVNNYSHHLALAANFNATASTVSSAYTQDKLGLAWCSVNRVNVVSPSTITNRNSNNGADWVAFSVMVRSS